jgi:hypothetical protein
METIHLVGTESIQRAAMGMQDAAEHMANVSANLQIIFEQQQLFLDEWLNRFEAVLQAHRPEVIR